MKVVVDTNVAVVANKRAPQASPECIRGCSMRLNEVMENGTLVLDNKWLILQEYMRNLSSTGQPGNGDKFFKWVLSNYKNPHRCEMVNVTLRNDDRTDFEEFPLDPALADFDRNDKKFIAVVLAHHDRPPILQSVDTQWWQMRYALNRAGVQVEFLCQADIRRILRQ